MMLNKHWIVGGLVLLISVFAMLGGSWSSSYGEGVNQGTVPTLTPTEEEEPDPTSTPRRPVPTPVVPRLTMDEVVCGKSVTLRTQNFPANQDFKVYMNVIRTRGIGGILVATVNSGRGGELKWTFNIPAKLKREDRIAIRLESRQGYYSYDWFYNRCGGGQTPPPDSTSTEPTLQPLAPVLEFRIPSFTITGVSRGESVTVKTVNLPANEVYVVRMGAFGTRGVKGEEVDTVQVSKSGVLTLTFKIPERLKGERRIAIRFESTRTGYFSYNFFYNNNYP